jgi:hypothetical protein
MSTRVQSTIVVFVVGILLVSQGPLHGDLVAVGNPGVEAQTLTDGGTVSPISDWSGFGTVFAMNPSSMQYFGGTVPEGENVAMLAGTAVMLQVLSATAQIGICTVEFDVGQRLDAATLSAVFSLVAQDPLTPDSGFMPAPGAGQFAPAQFVYSVLPGSPNESLVGNPLQLRFQNLAGTATFDNVRVNFTAIPEPSAAGLVLAMLASLAGRRRMFS